MLVHVRIIGNLPYLVKGLQRHYVDLPLAGGARLSDLLRLLNIERELLAFGDGKRLTADELLCDGMEITLISPSAGG